MKLANEARMRVVPKKAKMEDKKEEDIVKEKNESVLLASDRENSP